MNKQDVVRQARQLLASHSRIHALADKDTDRDEDVSWLVEALASEVERLRGQVEDLAIGDTIINGVRAPP